MRNILNARSALIQADANRALVTCAGRNLPGRSQEFPPVGASVRIALRGEWVGTFRALGRSTSNLILERGQKVLKWPKYKTRLVMAQPEEQLGNVTGHPGEEIQSEEEPAKVAERRHIRARHRKNRAQAPSAPPASSVDPAPLTEEEIPDLQSESTEVASGG